MKKLLILLSFAAFVGIAACSTNAEEEETKAPERRGNPNGDSELALLMRDMFDEGTKIKAQLEKGEKPSFALNYHEIHSAKATDSAEAATPQFKAFAASYVSSVNALQSANSAEAPLLYQGMVNSCINCHKTFCPGPVSKIEKLR